MPNIPAELLLAYADIIRQAPDAQTGAAHLMNFLLDADKLVKAIDEAINEAKQRAGTS